MAEPQALFRFDMKQEIFDIGGVKIGGQPGELPTVLIGSLFHEGHRIVKDRKLGLFNKRKAEHLINLQEEMSDKTGIPCMLDVVGETAEALIRYIDFVSEVTDVPFLINGAEASVRISASQHAVQIGLQNRAIYNSINYTLGEEEIQAIKKLKLEAAIVQAFNPSNPLPNGMISLLKGTNRKKGLLKAASEAGIKKPLIFTPVLDVPAIGFGARGIYLAKEEFGLPTGTAPVGVVGRWKKVDTLGKYAKIVCRGGATTLAQAMGADYIIYGSVAKARKIFPVCAMTDAIIAYNARNYGVRPLTKNHPLYKIF
ncbi:tetrahydromethanopterin S-methyltransferase subunit H [Candidatus Bathyarchaeota archaeon ex4484_231]|nr:MAG: tetrahydromethanopterin S-methyltransferase subunit H [Candidatus Bathyarchaeota archaeon ex4484_231]